MRVDPTLLVNVTAIAERVGVPRTNVNAWTRSSAFPKEIETPGIAGRIYFWPEVAAYISARPHLGIDLESSASRQHYIDTGVYLKHDPTVNSIPDSEVIA